MVRRRLDVYVEEDIREYIARTALNVGKHLYSARCWSTHRKEAVAAWAAQYLPLVLAVQKDDGGFSFRHASAMADHAGIAMSLQEAEGDMWGTLMYLGTIKMLVALAYPQVEVPWRFSYVHRVPDIPLLGADRSAEKGSLYKEDS